MKEKVINAIKGAPALAMALLLFGGLGSAAVLNYYGVIGTTAEVGQSILLDGLNYDTPVLHNIAVDYPTHGANPGGETFCYKHWLENKMSVEGDIYFETSEISGITTTYYKMPLKTTLVLENKDSEWAEIEDSIQATLTFDTVGSTFNYELTGSVGLVSTDYALIYYADKPDRFVDWGGDNPGMLLATVTSDASGNIQASGTPDIGMNLPTGLDANIAEYDYCISDTYSNCHGAKIWLVPASDYTAPALTAWNPTTYLFETDLIVYYDCDLLPDDGLVDIYGTPFVDLTLESGEKVPMLVCYGFDQAIMPNTYTVNTWIRPGTRPE